MQDKRDPSFLLMKEYEENVLDIHHETLDHWRHDRDVAAYGCLAAFDALSLHLVDQQTTVPLIQELNHKEEALNQSLRWLLEGHYDTDLRPTADAGILESASKFMAHAEAYHILFDMHRHCFKDILEVIGNRDTRTIRFSTPQSLSQVRSFGFLESATLRQGAARSMGRNLSEMFQADIGSVEEELRQIQPTFQDGRIVLTQIQPLINSTVADLADCADLADLTHIPLTTDLGGFTLADLRQYYHGIRTWSFAANTIFINSIGESHIYQRMPTQVVDRQTFLKRMVELSGLSPELVSVITERLTFGNSVTTPDIFLQPLICGSNSVAWSARVVLETNYIRNMLRLMARIPDYKAIADNLIGEQERAMLRGFGEHLQQRGGYAFKLLQAVNSSTEQGDIDLLAYSPRHVSEVLIVEGKSLLGVHEVNEVDAATLEMQRGQRQLEKIQRILAEMSLDRKTATYPFVRWEDVQRVYPLVVTPDSEPNEKYDHSRIPSIALTTLRTRLTKSKYASPETIWTTCRDRKWLDGMNWEEKYWPIKIGDVTYEIPYYRLIS